MDKNKDYIKMLDDENRVNRLKAVIKLKEAAGERHNEGRDINNHIHTKYSFSPYFPAKAAWLAYEAGLSTAGIVDHDSVAGVPEFIEAAGVLGLPVTTGFEVRASLKGTRMEDMRLNNPDQKGNAYITLQGLPHNRLDYINNKLKPYRQHRLERVREMAEHIKALVLPYGIGYDFEKDVLPLTCFNEGGTITERYLLYALAKGIKLVEYLSSELRLKIPEMIKGYLLVTGNPYYIYDILGLLKAEFLDKIYIPGGLDCPPVEEMVLLARETGAFITYCYLGDQGNSATGDKKEAKFEDDRLEEIISAFKDIGFNAVAYMPTRNTNAQISRLKGICGKHQMFEICGEDINQPRQKFICEKMREPLYADAYDNTFALIGHEYMITKYGTSAGMTSAGVPLKKKVEEFGRIGKELFNKQ
jgi:hypothetical protein